VDSTPESCAEEQASLETLQRAQQSSRSTLLLSEEFLAFESVCRRAEEPSGECARGAERDQICISTPGSPRAAVLKPCVGLQTPRGCGPVTRARAGEDEAWVKRRGRAGALSQESSSRASEAWKRRIRVWATLWRRKRGERGRLAASQITRHRPYRTTGRPGERRGCTRSPLRNLSPMERPSEPAALLCPIMYTLLRDPVVTSYGTTYERAALDRAWQVRWPFAGQGAS